MITYEELGWRQPNVWAVEVEFLRNAEGEKMGEVEIISRVSESVASEDLAEVIYPDTGILKRRWERFPSALNFVLTVYCGVATRSGLEPPISALTGQYVNQLHHRATRSR